MGAARWSEFFKQYGDSTTIHGCGYIFKPRTATSLSYPERLVWSLFVATGLWLALLLSWELYRDFQASPVITTIDSVAKSIFEIEHPVVTICGQGFNIENSLKPFGAMAATFEDGYEEVEKSITLLKKEIHNWPDNLTLVDFFMDMTQGESARLQSLAMQANKAAGINPAYKPVLEALLDPNKLAAMRQIEMDLKSELKNRTKAMLEDSRNYVKLMTFLMHSSWKCNEIIIGCLWKGQLEPCAEIFLPTITDRGICCSFNFQMDRMLSNQTYTSKITKIMDAHYPQKELNITVAPGLAQGLTLVLDAHNDLISPGTVLEDFYGFLASVTNQEDANLMITKNFLIPPGKVTYVQITATDVTVDEKLKDGLGGEDRGCYFRDEKELDVFGDYTQTRCLAECVLKEALKESGNCTPWFYPSKSGILCNSISTSEFIEFAFTYSGKCLHCLPDCHMTKYDYKVTSSPLRPCSDHNMGVSLLCKFQSPLKPQLWSDLAKEEITDPSILGVLESPIRQLKADSVFGNLAGGRTYNAYDRDIAVASFFFADSTAMSIKKAARITPTGFVAQIGGLFGLCLGFSLLSFVELIYWFVYRMMKVAVA